jgi:hypothetical protein
MGKKSVGFIGPKDEELPEGGVFWGGGETWDKSALGFEAAEFAGKEGARDGEGAWFVGVGMEETWGYLRMSGTMVHKKKK